MIPAVKLLVPLAELTSDDRMMWGIALAVGAVVLVVVVALLNLLLRVVTRVDEGVQDVWRSAKRLAANTSTTWQLRETAAAVEAIREEAGRHDAMLEDRL